MSPAGPTITRNPPTASEWKLRVELAAAFRLADQFGWTELV